MIDRIKEFRSVINFGMEQLIDYLDARNEDYRENAKIKDSHPIVYQENLALLEEEKMYIQHTVDFVKSIDINQFKSPEEFRDYLLEDIKTYYKKHSIPNVCYIIMSDKINKCWKFYEDFFCD